jgi:transcriptional regulator of acetoin/glycerol metabolism
MIKLETKTFNLKEIEKQAVVAAITYSKGNVQFARELLNVSKATMYRLLREYNVDFATIRDMNNWNYVGFSKKGDRR